MDLPLQLLRMEKMVRCFTRVLVKSNVTSIIAGVLVLIRLWFPAGSARCHTVV